MNEVRHLYVPVILGTTRKGRMSAYAAQFMLGQLQKREGVKTDLIDIAELRLAVFQPRWNMRMRLSSLVLNTTIVFPGC